MQVTFMIRLIVSLVSELKSKGFEIGRTDVTEDKIEVLTFQNDGSDYTVAISPVKEGQDEYLKLTGSVRENWRITEELQFQIEPLVKGLRCGDRMNIECIENGDLLVRMTKCIDLKFDMEGVDKNATRALALDIIGSVVN